MISGIVNNNILRRARVKTSWFLERQKNIVSCFDELKKERRCIRCPKRHFGWHFSLFGVLIITFFRYNHYSYTGWFDSLCVYLAFSPSCFAMSKNLISFQLDLWLDAAHFFLLLLLLLAFSLIRYVVCSRFIHISHLTLLRHQKYIFYGKKKNLSLNKFFMLLLGIVIFLAIRFSCFNPDDDVISRIFGGVLVLLGELRWTFGP
jgi:hypothetical protein